MYLTIGFSGTTGNVTCNITGTTSIKGTLKLFENDVEIDKWTISSTTIRANVLDSFTAVSGRTYKLVLDVDVTANGYTEAIDDTTSKTCPQKKTYTLEVHMRNLSRKLALTILAVLCLVSLVLPIYAANCAKCAVTLTSSVNHNNAYRYKYEYHNTSSVYCYEYRNERCERRCQECNHINYVDHYHDNVYTDGNSTPGGRTEHNIIIEGDFYACSRIGSYYSRLINPN